MSAGTNGDFQDELTKAQTEGNNLPSVYIAYPYSRPHPDKFLRSVVYAASYPGNYGEVWLAPLYGYSLDAARNRLTENFKESGSDFMLFVDNDCSFSPLALERLVSHNLPMVCGCMYTRSIPPKSTIGKYVGKSKKGVHIYEFAGVMKATLEKARQHGITHENAQNDMLFPKTDTDLMEVDGCGSHFVLIRRDVVEALTPPYYVFLGDTHAGEDFYFCRKVKEAGFPIYVDLSVQTGHIDSEDHDYGIRELLYLTQYIDMNDLVNVDSWEFPLEDVK